MSEYLSTKEVAKMWGTTPNKVSVLCKNEVLVGAKKINNRWMIPMGTPNPINNISKKGKTASCDFTFIDLFAGIGGFHQAMRYLGGKCIMASEIDADCRSTYKLNYKTRDIRGDIRKIEADSIGKFDMLCAGFPCQPFSKAGYQKGFEDEGRGDLFYNILRILDHHQECKYILLENVRNLADKEDNWNIIKEALIERDFIISEKPIILSPSNFGIPQIRERVYILGIKKEICSNTKIQNGFISVEDLGLKQIKNKNICRMGDAFKILEKNVSREYFISDEEEEVIQAWDEFRRDLNIGVIGFPIWLNSFGLGIEDELVFKRSQGYYGMPDWKKKYVDSNRLLYTQNKKYIDKWVIRHNMLGRNKVHQKFEWNCGNDVNSIQDAIIQIRQSGIRVKRPTYFPALVAIINTPIIYDKKKKHYRRITPREAANLQSFNKRFKFSGSDSKIYKQLGNSVNVKILKILGKKLFELSTEE